MALVGTTNEQKIWNYLKAQGLSDCGAAGLMGNLYAESGLIPTNVQNSYEKKLGYTDETYTAAVDNGSYANFVRDAAGYGLAQWTYWSRKQGLLEYAKAAGKSVGDLEVQLGYLLKELSSYGLLASLKSATSVKEASNLILLKFEKPASMNSTATQTKRAGYGQTYYDKYAGGTTASKPTATAGGAKMNKQPVSYLQTDPRWKNKPYRVKGETATIGSSGCGPTAAAMLIETITGRTFTPEDACKWSLEHGYKALNAGTYYAYFAPQFAAHGIECQQMNWVNTYGKPNSDNHKKAFDLLKQGYYLIALMGKGLWTSSGHFVVVWWEDGKVHINDPASTKPARLTGDLTTFKSQVKYYWWIDARKYNAGGEAAKPSMPTTTTPPATTAVAERKATGVATGFNKALAGAYTVTAKSGLHVRNVAGAKTGSMILLPYGTKVQNYGYFTEVNGVKWLYIQVAYQGVKYTGFSSGQYLAKK